MAKNETNLKATVAKVEVEEQTVETTAGVETTVEEVDEIAEVKSVKEIVNSLVKNGCKLYKNVRIKNVNVTDMDTYTRVSFTIDKPVPGYRENDEGDYVKTNTTTIFSSTYAIAAAFKEDDELSWMANYIIDNPKVLNLILNGSNCDFIRQEVAAGEDYVNPFSSNAEEQNFDHDIYITHIISFKLGKIGSKMADKLADKIMESTFDVEL